MAKIYKNQYNFKLTLETGVTLTGATTTLIKYRKPDATTGSWTATISGTEDLFYNFTASTELDQSGDWHFWAHVTFSDGRPAPGEAVVIRVYEESN